VFRQTYRSRSSLNFTNAWKDEQRSFAPGDEDEEEDDEENGTTEDDEGEGSSGTGTTDDSQGGKVRDPEAKARSAEAAKYRTERNQYKADLEAAAKRLRELEDKDKSELEKAQRDLAEATKRAEAAEERADSFARENAVFKSGASGLTRDLDALTKFLDLSDLKPDDEGAYDQDEILKRVKELLDKKPYLKVDEDSTSGNGEKDPSGRPANGSRKGSGNDAALKKKFPALAGRG
jgi:hypothetical protein